jgi:hypothetical protein
MNIHINICLQFLGFYSVLHRGHFNVPLYLVDPIFVKEFLPILI